MLFVCTPLSAKILETIKESFPKSQQEQASQEAGIAKSRIAGLPSAGPRLLRLYEEFEEERKKHLSERLAAPDGGPANVR